MTGFSLDVAGWKPAVAVVAAHGITDLNTMEWVPHYAVWSLLPMPSCMVTGVFCASSMVHFCEDGGAFVSIMVHLSVAMVALKKGSDAAFKAMLVYLLVWHTPKHYTRHLRKGRKRGVLVAFLATLSGILMCHKLPSRLVLTDWLQRIVIAHISHELSLT